MSSSLIRRPLWLIAKEEDGRLEVLTFCLACGEETLPVFSFEEEAELFLRFSGSSTGWRVAQTTAGNLISVLHGPCADVEKVALDPPVEFVDEALLGLLTLSRKDLMRTLAGGRRRVHGAATRRCRRQDARQYRLRDGR